ncbi:outer membrane beta-barrel protein [Sphingobacterium detergens]|uniref:Outer membrane protein with beta-barrel domain n=1 Tax=Sphingobacterium detergens TaxID=1145106 RepID=A0A420BIR8_SPHD1|nr:outer membrane beta-barrel protein [Sphingobacterium detergens]RKE56598.1 outer membrane protein with beta-barrel domain [Sphingobacterium detergens]
MCKLKDILLIILVVLVGKPSKAQFFFGLSSGYSKNYMASNFDRYFTKKNVPRGGFVCSIDVELYLKRRISMSFSLMYIQKRYSSARIDNYSEIITKMNNNYLQFPLKFQFAIPVINKFCVLLSGGTYMGYWIDAYIKGHVPDIFSLKVSQSEEQIEYYRLVSYQEKYQFNGMKDDRIEFGMVIGTGAEYFLHKNIKLKLDVDYFGSLIEQEK